LPVPFTVDQTDLRQIWIALGPRGNCRDEVREIYIGEFDCRRLWRSGFQKEAKVSVTESLNDELTMWIDAEDGACVLRIFGVLVPRECDKGNGLLRSVIVTIGKPGEASDEEERKKREGRENCSFLERMSVCGHGLRAPWKRGLNQRAVDFVDYIGMEASAAIINNMGRLIEEWLLWSRWQVVWLARLSKRQLAAGVCGFECLDEFRHVLQRRLILFSAEGRQGMDRPSHLPAMSL